MNLLVNVSRRAAILGSVSGLLAGTAQAQGQPARSLKIGVLTDMSGSTSDATGRGSLVATQMAVDDFRSGADGALPVEVISADHLNKPDTGSSIARRWFDGEGVDVVVDLANSAVALAVSQVVREKNKVMLAASPASSDLTGRSCTRNLVQWTYDSYALAVGSAVGVLAAGKTKWFLVVADYAFGHTMDQDISAIIAKDGGQVVGRVQVPQGAPDFSSYLLEAKASQAQVVALLNAGADTINSIKQAVEFGLPDGGQQLVATVLYLTDVHSLGLSLAQGLQFTQAFYWDLNDGTRAWSERFTARLPGRRPTALHAGCYASTLHYLRCASGLTALHDGAAVVEAMKAMPTDDPLFGKGSIRVDGRKLHPMYLFQVKTPAESHGPWDYYKVLRTLPSDQVWRPLNEGGCPLVKS